MKKKCVKCGRIIDTESDEFLTTAEGPLCIECANEGYSGQSDMSSLDDTDQSYL